MNSGTHLSLVGDAATPTAPLCGDVGPHSGLSCTLPADHYGDAHYSRDANRWWRRVDLPDNEGAGPNLQGIPAASLAGWQIVGARSFRQAEGDSTEPGRFVQRLILLREGPPDPEEDGADG